MSCSRRQAIAAVSVGLTAPLLVDERASAAGAAVIAVKNVPVGGGVVVASRRVVVTQPTRGRFHVFSAVCTHEGCLVSRVGGGHIDCPCHGSEFAVTTGAVLAGPASRPLPPRAFRIKRGKLYLR